jgi:hypothetical protein
MGFATSGSERQLTRGRKKPSNAASFVAEYVGDRSGGSGGPSFRGIASMEGLSKTMHAYVTAYVHAPVPSPTRASVMTGRRPDQVRLQGARTVMQTDSRTSIGARPKGSRAGGLGPLESIAPFHSVRGWRGEERERRALGVDEVTRLAAHAPEQQCALDECERRRCRLRGGAVGPSVSA